MAKKKRFYQGKSMTNREMFLSLVYEYVLEDPDCLQSLSETTEKSLLDKIDEFKEMATDFELALYARTKRKTKKNVKVIYSTLTKWNGKTKINWDDHIAKLRLTIDAIEEEEM